MSNDSEFRFSRIKKLIEELFYEIERGIDEKDIGECIRLQRVLRSNEVPDGVLVVRLETQPMTRRAFNHGEFYAFKDELTLINKKRHTVAEML